jgi:hypothetical protein
MFKWLCSVFHVSFHTFPPRTIFAALSKILFSSSTKPDIRVCAVDCVRSLQDSLRGEKLWLWSDDPHQQEELRKITAASL